MSEAKQETVADIVAEMRTVAKVSWVKKFEWIDRIEAAYRLSQFTPRQLTEIAQQAIEFSLLLRENARLKDTLSMCEKINEQQDKDNARLRAALRPVLEFQERPCFVDPHCSLSLAVREAQHIYNEGTGEKSSVR